MQSTVTTTDPAPPTPPAAEQPGATPAAPAPATLTIGDKQYSVPNLTVPTAQLANEIDAHLDAQKLNPIDAMVQTLDRLHKLGRLDLDTKVVDVAFTALRRSKTKSLNLNDVADWIRSESGIIWLTWRALRQEHADVTLEQVEHAMLSRKEAARGV